MKFVIGGAWQGKTNAACGYFDIDIHSLIDGRDCDPDEIYVTGGIHHFHEYLRRMLQKEANLSGFIDRLYQKNPRILIISDEIGYGLVPMDAFERHWREQTGRICCEIAAKSDVVLRVTAGIPMVIKG